MDLHYSQTSVCAITCFVSLNPLWIYTTLKLKNNVSFVNQRLNPLWIYTTLKPAIEAGELIDGLNPLWIYTTLKPNSKGIS